MIRNEAAYRFSLPDNRGAKGFTLPAEGSVVTIRVLGSSPGGTRILLAGREIVASGIGGFPRGADVPVRVSYGEGTVFLQALVPAEEMRSRALLAQLGLPATPVSLQIVFFLKQLQARLEPSKIAAFARVAAKFPGKEAQSAEAAVILDAAGIGVDEASVGDFLFLMGEGGSGESPSGEGTLDRESGNGNRSGIGESETPHLHGERHSSSGEGGISSVDSLLARVNRKNGSSRQWYAYPFSQKLDGVRCSGSLRFLVDALAGTVIETRITFTDGLRTQRFVLDAKASTCRFDSDPSFLPVSSERFVVYLKEALGHCDVSYGSIDGMGQSAAEGVDLEA